MNFEGMMTAMMSLMLGVMGLGQALSDIGEKTQSVTVTAFFLFHFLLFYYLCFTRIMFIVMLWLLLYVMLWLLLYVNMRICMSTSSFSTAIACCIFGDIFLYDRFSKLVMIDTIAFDIFKVIRRPVTLQLSVYSSL